MTIMIGKMVLQFRRRFGHGVQTAWYRDVVRPRILQTAPIIADDSSICEIHVLTSSLDWLNLIWSLKSFYHVTGRRYALAVHDDGTLESSHRETLSYHFPAARIIDRPGANRRVESELEHFPRCQQFRRTNPLAPKVFDFRSFLQSERMLLLDSDVLFFSVPAELLRRIEDSAYCRNSVNGDVASAYTVDSSTALKHCDVTLLDRFNSGLGVIHRESIDLTWIEEFLGIPGIIGHFWRIEQTLFALCSSRFGAELLPEEYDVFLNGPAGDRQSRHYVGAIRHLMYREGIARLWKSGGWTRPGAICQGC